MLDFAEFVLFSDAREPTGEQMCTNIRYLPVNPFRWFRYFGTIERADLLYRFSRINGPRLGNMLAEMCAKMRFCAR